MWVELLRQCSSLVDASWLKAKKETTSRDIEKKDLIFLCNKIYPNRENYDEQQPICDETSFNVPFFTSQSNG